jgi:hypothetical protein
MNVKYRGSTRTLLMIMIGPDFKLNPNHQSITLKHSILCQQKSTVETYFHFFGASAEINNSQETI